MFHSAFLQVLDDISFTVLPSQHTTVVVKTGCGKSSIFSFIERFYEPTKVKSIIDGLAVVSVNAAAHHLSIGLMSRDPTIFSVIIREILRIGLGNQEASEAASEYANIYPFLTARISLRAIEGYTGRCLDWNKEARK